MFDLIKNIIFALFFVCVINTTAKAKPYVNNAYFRQESNSNIEKKSDEKETIFKDFNFFKKPRFVTNVPFKNEKGEALKISDFRGKVLLVNLWSNTCGICIIELPMLNHLQNIMGSPRFEVISMAVGWGDAKKIRRYFVKKGLGGLTPYSDENKKFYKAVGAMGFPTTMLIDVNGCEIGRTRGMVKWDSSEFIAKIRKLTQEKQKKSVLQKYSWSNKHKKNKMKKNINLGENFTKSDEEFLNINYSNKELNKIFDRTK
jgi:thiol-disulfide isomerase/thioredoxin